MAPEPPSLPPDVASALPDVLAASTFLARICDRDPGLLPRLAASGELQRPLEAEELAARAPWIDLPAGGADAEWDQAMLAALRRWRCRELLRIGFRDLAGWASLGETLAELSGLGDVAIRTAARAAEAALVARHGVPRNERGDAQPLVVVAMGKLGGRELNFSSDVDLVLLFPEHGETDGARSISNEEYFTRAAQGLRRMLEQATPEGLVLRVDLRLRPFGDSGPPVCSFAAFEDYLPRHGRDWERYAWIKARPVTGVERWTELEAVIRPFVYRRYLDYGVFESLREMKALIAREVARRDRSDDVKLGPGGIREVEFIVQSLQLIRGGRDRRLQTPSLLAALAGIEAGRLLPQEICSGLRAAYGFLRRLENRLQMDEDQQVHALPVAAGARLRLARAMQLGDAAQLDAALKGHRDFVSGQFHELVVGTAGRDAAPPLDLGAATLAAELRAAGIGEAEEAARLIAELLEAAPLRRLEEPGRRRLQALLPQLVAAIARLPAADPAGGGQLATLRRVLRIVESIGSRSAYFALLTENVRARARLVELSAHGDFLAGRIAREPLLLDELLDERLLGEPPARAELDAQLDERLSGSDADPESQLDALREFRNAAVFRVAAADLTGRLPVMRVSDRLTDIAELVIDRALQMAWQQITAQYGVPHCTHDGRRRQVGVCAVGYGKLGGLELGYGSDLDLVFLHDSAGEQQETDGSRPLDNQVFFVRLAQRILHVLTVHSPAGRLYEVDVRLRPSGKGGLLMTSIAAFDRYQREEAWTWEHQALLHARAVAGEPGLRARFEAVRVAVLGECVRRETLREEVRDMRERMRREHDGSNPDRFDLKHDRGGMADIEFLAQYFALRWAQDYPPVITFADTIRQLESVASAALVPQSAVDRLTGAYRAYRARAHRLALAAQPQIVPAGEFAAERAAVTGIWEQAMSGSADAIIEA